MIEPESFFGNLFTDPKITTTRLANFASDFVNNTTADNKDDKYTPIISLVQTPLNAVLKEQGEVASSLAFQKGKTKTNDDVLNQFIATMRAKEGVIADIFGGKDTAQYLAFYPQGVRQYSKANKTTMPTLTQQAAMAAAAYKTELGSTLASLLQSFPDMWTESRNTQQQQKGDVKDNRTDRSENRILLEIALCDAMHRVGSMYPAQAAKCGSLFSFSMLYPQTKHTHTSYNNALMKPLETDTVFNLKLTDTNDISLHNSDDNATWVAWLAPDETSAYPGNGIVVEPGKTVNVKPSQLGDINNTFLRIMNLSEVNEGSYEVTLS